MKSVSVGFDQSIVIDDDDAKAKFKYQTLLKEYLELQKEYVSRKRKLQAAKQKTETTLAEVRFLRRKLKYLSKSQAPPNIEKVTLHLHNSDIECNALERGRNQSTSKAAPNNFDLISNSHLKNERKERSGHEKDVRFTKKLKNHLVQDKGVGKRKACWPDRVTLKQWNLWKLVET